LVNQSQVKTDEKMRSLSTVNSKAMLSTVYSNVAELEPEAASFWWSQSRNAMGLRLQT
jgi:hypothetical protein